MSVWYRVRSREAVVLPRPAQDAALEEDGGQLLPGHRPGDVHDAGHVGVIPGDAALGLPQELQGGGDQPQVLRGGEVAGESPAASRGPPPRRGWGAGGRWRPAGRRRCRPPCPPGARNSGTGRQEPGDVPLPGVDQHGLQHHLQEVADLVALLLGDLVVGEDELVQILPPQGEGDLLRRIAGGVGGDPLAVDQVELGDDPAHEGPRLPADVTLPVDQQLIEEGQGLFLLADGQIGAVLLEDIQIGPQLLPALGGAGRLDDVAEFLLVGQHVHQPDVVLHRDAHQAVQGLLGVHQGGVLVGGGLLGLSGQIHVHPQVAHVVLEVVELAVDELIAVLLVGVHILQLLQDDLEGVLQGEENDLLPALFVPGLLGAEVGVDEQQGLGGQGLQLQVPGGVVGGDVADPLHPPGQQPLVGVVVVEEGDVLPRAAAELAQVVGGGRPGHQGQVQLTSRLLQPLGPHHGDVVDPGDVVQGAEGGDLQPQAHHLIDVLLPPGGQEAAVFPAQDAGVGHLRGQELKVHQGIEGQDLPLPVQEDLEHGQAEQGPVSDTPGPGGRKPPRGT